MSVSQPIVGVGASAGGFEAFTEMLAQIPKDAGISIILVQHLDRSHRSLLTDALAGVTSLSVTEAVDNTTVEANHVYVIPPNKNLAVADGVLCVTERDDSKPNLAIDVFFRSLALASQHPVIGVLLSGLGNDGTEGLRALKQAGFITYAQLPTSAKFPHMPASAIEAGLVDCIMTPAEIGQDLVRITKHTYMTRDTEAGQTGPEPTQEEALKRVFAIMRTTTGFDFSEYKTTTIQRRLARRMALLRVIDLPAYLAILESYPDEVRTLARDMLIHVTRFFRDPKTFESLREKVFPELVKRHSDGSPIRIWVPGCSTGEEVYSLAISLLDMLGEEATSANLQIFGTDISGDAIAKARVATYEGDTLKGVTAAQLQHYFARREDRYSIAKRVRDCCIFVRHDLTRDPPLARLDMVSCRNILIYFGAALQKQVLPLFHYGLNSSGFLLLGNTETISGFTHLFTPVDKLSNIFCKVGVSRGIGLMRWQSATEGSLAGTALLPRMATLSEVQKQADSLLLARHVTPAVLVNHELEVIHVRGRTGPFLELAPGQPNLSLLRLAREGLGRELRLLFEQVKSQLVAIQRDGIEILDEGVKKVISVEIIPLPPLMGGQHFYLVLFENTPARDAPLALVPHKAVEEKRLAKLQEELTATRDYLLLLLDERQRMNDELSFANEELVSANEELQSTNEEMETAKEELQATNEELITVNDELQTRNTELNHANSDLINLLGSMDIPVVMIGPDGNVRKFTPPARHMLNLIPSDVGRSIHDIKFNVSIPGFKQEVDDVLHTAKSKELDVTDQQGKWYRLRLRPYLNVENNVDGVILSLFNIDALKRQVTKYEEALSYVNGIVEHVGVPLLVLDPNKNIVSSNDAFFLAFSEAKRARKGNHFFETHPEWDVAGLSDRLDHILGSEETLFLEAEVEVPGRGMRRVAINACAMGPRSSLLLLTLDDVTERTALLDMAEQAKNLAEDANRLKDEFLSTLSHELRTPLATILLRASMLQDQNQDAESIQHIGRVIQTAAEAQTRLVDDLLDATRIASGTLKVVKSPVNVADVVKCTIDTVRVDANAKSIRLQLAIDGDTGIVLGDALRLKQVVGNLLSNAIKFSDEGEVVTVTCQRAGQQAEISVADCGRGIDAAFLPHIFKRFARADSSNTRGEGGLGLGLTIVHDLVRLHDGTVDAKSPGLGKGSTFTVRLPISAVDKEVEGHEGDRTEEDSVPDVAGTRVLIIDDDDGMRDSIAEVLHARGAEVCAVESGQRGLSMFYTFHPDVLLCDIAMPDEDGYSVIRKIRACRAECGGNTPAAALTALSGPDDQKRVIEAGFQMFLSKPISLNAVCGAVAELAKLRRTNNERLN